MSRKRKSYIALMRGVMYVCSGLTAALLLFLLGYVLYKGIPNIDFQRLAELRAALETPLVLHGGSSSGDENLHKCATGGISKINIYTDFVLSAYKKVEERGGKDYYAIRQAMKDGMMECLEHYYDVFDTRKYNA